MKKKLAIIIIILLASGGITWAVLNQSQQSKAPTSPIAENSSKKSTIPGGQTIVDKDNSTNKHPSDKSNDQPQKPATPQHLSSVQQGNSSPNSTAPQQSSNTQPHTHKPAPQQPQASQPQPQTPIKPNNPPSQPQPPVTPPQPPVNPPTTPPTPPQPPVTPQPPITPPQPPKPPVTPPQQGLTDEQKAQKILNDLKSPTNDNVAQFTNDDGQIRTVLWTKGITGPRLGAGGDFRRIEETHGGNQFVTYAAKYSNAFLNKGWYDVDKSHGSSVVDRNLCFGAVAANQLHWWMNYHKDRVNQFLTKTDYINKLPPTQKGTFKDLTIYPNSFKNQQDSKFFGMMKTYFGNNREGYYADPLIDMVLNGHKPKGNGGYNDPDWTGNFQMDSRGGFFHDVLGKKNLTRRLTISYFDEFSREAQKALKAGESIGIIHMTSGNYTHIITAWGLEYDLDGRLVGVYVTDSDDQDDPHTNGMKRYGVNSVNQKAVLSNNLTNPKAGARIDQISTLGLGEDRWSKYLK